MEGGNSRWEADGDYKYQLPDFSVCRTKYSAYELEGHIESPMSSETKKKEFIKSIRYADGRKEACEWSGAYNVPLRKLEEIKKNGYDLDNFRIGRHILKNQGLASAVTHPIISSKPEEWRSTLYILGAAHKIFGYPPAGKTLIVDLGEDEVKLVDVKDEQQDPAKFELPAEEKAEGEEAAADDEGSGADSSAPNNPHTKIRKLAGGDKTQGAAGEKASSSSSSHTTEQQRRHPHHQLTQLPHPPQQQHPPEHHPRATQQHTQHALFHQTNRRPPSCQAWSSTCQRQWAGS